MTTALAAAPRREAPDERADRGELARTLKNLILRDASDEQIKLAIRVCERYGFDPLLRHVLFISGNLYVTRDGLLDNAHRSGHFDGIEVVGTEYDATLGGWTATVRVWRNDMGHPFTYTAHQAEHENERSPVWKKAPRAMTVKCAEVMALRRAFNVALGSAEEIGFDEHAAPPDPLDGVPTTYGGVRTGGDGPAAEGPPDLRAAYVNLVTQARKWGLDEKYPAVDAPDDWLMEQGKRLKELLRQQPQQGR